MQNQIIRKKRKYTLYIQPKSIQKRIEENSMPVTESGCWIWLGFTRKGYGRMTIGSRLNDTNKPIDAHRASYMSFIGEIPKGMHVLHKCDTPSCVNPYHLFLGTHNDNMKDKVAKGRQPSLFGNKNNCAKITEKQVLEIRASLLSSKELSKLYNISKTNIYDIKKRKIWRHI